MNNDMTTPADPPVLLVSPREPSGVSWIINCLLELGIRVDLQPTVDQIFGVGRQPASAMWLREAGGRWRLHPRASALEKWLPILSRESTFAFREIPPILHVQRLPMRAEAHGQVILFVRDLRDALHSLYRRTQPELTWQEFISWPHAETLLDAIDHWRLFIECWMAQSPLFIGRFEDYKADASALLCRVLQALRVECTSEEIARAVSHSSYAAAAAAEVRYRQAHPHDQQVVNRAGKVGEWETLSELRPTIHEMERRAGRLLQRLGYDVVNTPEFAEHWNSLAITCELSSFASIDVPSAILDAIPGSPAETDVAERHRFAEQLTRERLQQARLETEESRVLLRHLEEFSQCHAPSLTAQLQALSQSFAEGSAFHLARIRALLVSRRQDSAS